MATDNHRRCGQCLALQFVDLNKYTNWASLFSIIRVCLPSYTAAYRFPSSRRRSHKMTFAVASLPPLLQLQALIAFRNLSTEFFASPFLQVYRIAFGFFPILRIFVLFAPLQDLQMPRLCAKCPLCHSC